MSRFAKHNTPRHDDIHRFVNDEWNKHVICFKALRRKYKPCIFKRKLKNPKPDDPRDGWFTLLNPDGFLLDARIEHEVPIISGDYVHGMVDAIIRATFYRVKTITKTTKRKEYEYDIEATEQYPEVLLCEFKPTLDKQLTGILQQMNYYEKYVRQMYNPYTNKNHPFDVTKVLITYDQDRKSDKILKDNGIFLYRIEYNIQNIIPRHLLSDYRRNGVNEEKFHEYYFRDSLCCIQRFPAMLKAGLNNVILERYNKLCDSAHEDLIRDCEVFSADSFDELFWRK